MNYYDMLNKVAVSNRMVKCAGGSIAEAFGFKQPMPVKVQVPSFKTPKTKQEVDWEKLQWQSKKNQEEAKKVLAEHEKLNAEHRAAMEAKSEPKAEEPKEPDKLDQFFNNIRNVADIGQSAGQGIADAGKAVAGIMAPIGQTTGQAVADLKQQGEQLAEKAQKTYNDYKAEIEKLNPTNPEAAAVAGGK